MGEINPKIYDQAIKLLNLRQHTTGELQQKLKIRGYRPADLGPVLRKLEEQKFLDDERFAQIFVDNLKRYKDFGYFGLKSKLLKRQVPNEVAEKALAEFFTKEDELEVARRLVVKLNKQGRAEWEKLARSLQSRGFRNEVINRMLNSKPSPEAV